MRADPALFHRDTRSPNVLCSPRKKNWFLIGDAYMARTLAATHDVTHPSPRNLHLDVFLDGHGVEIDLWGVERLILGTAKRVVDLS
jgi:hypothetical protein